MLCAFVESSQIFTNFDFLSKWRRRRDWFGVAESLRDHPGCPISLCSSNFVLIPARCACGLFDFVEWRRRRDWCRWAASLRDHPTVAPSPVALLLPSNCVRTPTRCASDLIWLRQMAEKEGFEPPVALPRQLISSQSHSATLPLLLNSLVEKLIGWCFDKLGLKVSHMFRFALRPVLSSRCSSERPLCHFSSRSVGIKSGSRLNASFELRQVRHSHLCGGISPEAIVAAFCGAPGFQIPVPDDGFALGKSHALSCLSSLPTQMPLCNGVNCCILP